MKTENNDSIGGVAETNLMVLGDSTAMGMGNMTLSNAHSVGLLFEQQITKQRNDYQLGISNTAKSVDKILSNSLSTKSKILSKGWLAGSKYLDLINQL